MGKLPGCYQSHYQGGHPLMCALCQQLQSRYSPNPESFCKLTLRGKISTPKLGYKLLRIDVFTLTDFLYGRSYTT